MYYKLGQACITNWRNFVYYKLGQTLLQIGAASLLQIEASVVTNWVSHYKLEQLLLQNRAAITNWGKIYYKLGQVLQIRAIITNCGITVMFAISIENIEKTKISYIFFKKQVFLLLSVSVVMNMKKYLKKKNQLQY